MNSRTFKDSRRWLTGMAVSLGLSLGIVVADELTGLDGVRTEIPADDLAVVARGKVVYSESCAGCHGAELEGQADWRTRDANGLLPVS